MPRQRNPSTLQDMCLEPLMELLWDWWLISKWKQVAEVNEIFDYFQLPRYYAEEILEMLDENHEVYTGHVCLLLKLGMKQFTLTNLFYVDFDVIMQINDVSMQNLTHLDISRSRVPFVTLAKVPEAVPNVQILGLQFTQSNDSIMDSIAIYCSKLKNLDVSFCPITDEGIEKLGSKHSVCKMTLTTLNLNDTRITAFGASIALKNIPGLVDMDFQNAVELFDTMHALDLQCGCLEKVAKYNLRKIRFNLEPKSHRMHRLNHNIQDDYQLVSESFHIAIVTCPLLEHAVINEWNPHQPGSLHLFSHCSRLSVLEFNIKDYPMLTMEDFRPILFEIGQQLKSLTLQHVTNVDIIGLSTLCTNLKEISMISNSYTPPDIPTSMKYANLESLTIFGNFPNDVLHKLLVMIPNVNVLSIHHNYNLTSELLEEVFQVNIFQHLQTLNLAECDRFVEESLMLFIHHETELSEVTIENCRISYNQYFQVLRWIKKMQPTTDINFDFKSRIW